MNIKFINNENLAFRIKLSGFISIVYLLAFVVLLFMGLYSYDALYFFLSTMCLNAGLFFLCYKDLDSIRLENRKILGANFLKRGKKDESKN